MFKKRLPKQQVLKLHLDNTFEDVRLAFDRNKLIDGKDRPIFEPICVFQERKPRRALLRRPRRLLFLVDGATKALKFKEGDTTMMPFWTTEEAKEFVNVEIAKSMTKFKPMTWGQFIVLLIPLCITLLILIKIALSLGAL